MATTCCGQERVTRFCSDCGRELITNSPIHSLLMYLRRQLKTNEKDLSSNMKKVESAEKDGNSRNVDYFGKQVELANARVKKWQSWVDVVADAIEQAD